MEPTSSQSIRKSHRLSQPPVQQDKIYYCVKYTNERTYGIVEEKYIKLVDTSNWLLKMRGQKYGAKIIHVGHKAESEEKSKILEINLSIDSDREKRMNRIESSDEETTPKKRFKSNSNLKSNDKSTNSWQVLDADGDDEHGHLGNDATVSDDEDNSKTPILSPVKTPTARNQIRAATTSKKNKLKRKMAINQNNNKSPRVDGDEDDDGYEGDKAVGKENQKKKKAIQFYVW